MSPCGRAILVYCAVGLEPLVEILSTVQEQAKIQDRGLVVEELVGLIRSGHIECYFDSGRSMTPRKDVSSAEIEEYLAGPPLSTLMGIPLVEDGYYFETTDAGFDAAGLNSRG